MKIALLINELDIRGGTHKQLLRLCEYLEKQQIEFLIVTKIYIPELTYPQFAKYRILSLYTQEEFKIINQTYSGMKKILYMIKRILGHISLVKMIPKDIDIINIHDLGFNPTIRILKNTRKARIVWQINDLPVNFRVGNASNQIQTEQDKKICRSYIKTAKLVDRITVNVTKNKELVLQCLHKDADVLYCGVDINSNLQKHTYSMKDKHIRILSAGVFFPYRNYESLVSVIEMLNCKGYDATLDIIGATKNNPEYAQKIQKMIEDGKLTHKVKIWGQVDEPTYNNLFNKADIFSFININQSWGLAVFEAMSCGLPVIVSDSVGAIELLHDGNDSIILDPLDIERIADAVIRLYEDEEYYEMISDSAANAVLEFTWDSMYSEKLVKIFKEL
ncbi:MAG: glycosyltransferase family 4 protein [Acetatifactor sp.]